MYRLPTSLGIIALLGLPLQALANDLMSQAMNQEIERAHEQAANASCQGYASMLQGWIVDGVDSDNAPLSFGHAYNSDFWEDDPLKEQLAGIENPQIESLMESTFRRFRNEDGLSPRQLAPFYQDCRQIVRQQMESGGPVESHGFDRGQYYEQTIPSAVREQRQEQGTQGAPPRRDSQRSSEQAPRSGDSRYRAPSSRR